MRAKATVLLLTLGLCLSSVEAGMKNKEGGGEKTGGCKESDLASFQKCLDKG
jgi:hypothetical protein